jgi:hypothetical protein
MNKNILRLRLDYRDPAEKPVCNHCGEKYKKYQEFYRIVGDGEGGLGFFFASPENGFRNAEAIALSKEKLEDNGLPLSFGAYDKEDWQTIYRLLFIDKRGRVIWPRLRSLLTKRFKHPKQTREKPCRALSEKGEKFATLGPPKTIFMWAEPLIVALYALGLSYRDIVKTLDLPAPEQKGTGHQNSVRRRVLEYQEEHNDEKLDFLHQLNLGKHTCWKELPSDVRGVVWDIVIAGEPLNDLTVAWLETLAERYKQSLEVILADATVTRAAVYL